MVRRTVFWFIVSSSDRGLCLAFNFAFEEVYPPLSLRDISPSRGEISRKFRALVKDCPPVPAANLPP